MRCTIQSVLQQHFDSYAAQHRLPLQQWKAANALMNCRTAALGGHVQRCEAGHIVGVWFNSCRHRYCPRCNALKNERWLNQQREKLLGCAHRHVVFTIPSELRVLFRLNEALFTDALFDAVRDTMLTLVRDERHVGGTPGMMLARHTWSRSMAEHPHIHCLVSEGGLSPSGDWVSPKRRCFLPAKVVMSLYRGKLLHRLRTLLGDGELTFPSSLSAGALNKELYRLSQLDWNVRVGERYGHGVGVATYLARYLNGGALRDSQLRRTGGEDIAFSYTGHRANSVGACCAVPGCTRVAPRHALSRREASSNSRRSKRPSPSHGKTFYCGTRSKRCSVHSAPAPCIGPSPWSACAPHRAGQNRQGVTDNAKELRVHPLCAASLWANAPQRGKNDACDWRSNDQRAPPQAKGLRVIAPLS